MENLKLTNGTYLSRLYGKYAPNIILISNSPDEELKDDSVMLLLKQKQISFDGSIFWCIKGDFRINKKGNRVFQIDGNGSFILVGISWGGSFNDTTGSCNIPNMPSVYHRRASSNGGGLGKTYYVIKISDLENITLSEDDF